MMSSIGTLWDIIDPFTQSVNSYDEEQAYADEMTDLVQGPVPNLIANVRPQAFDRAGDANAA